MKKCPYCFTKLSEKLWTHDPLLSPRGAEVKTTNGNVIKSPLDERKYKGFNKISFKIIEELQEIRKSQEEEINLPIEMRTTFSPVTKNLYPITKKHIQELRDSTEKILNHSEQTFENYLNYDSDGNQMQTGDYYQVDWFDPKLIYSQISVRHIEDLRKHLTLVPIQYWLSLRGRSKDNEVHHNSETYASTTGYSIDVRFVMQLGFHWSTHIYRNRGWGPGWRMYGYDFDNLDAVRWRDKEDYPGTLYYGESSYWVSPVCKVTEFSVRSSLRDFICNYQYNTASNYKSELFAIPRNTDLIKVNIPLTELSSDSFPVIETPRFPGERDRVNPLQTFPRPKFVSCGFLEDAHPTSETVNLTPYEADSRLFTSVVGPLVSSINLPSLEKDEQVSIIETNSKQPVNFEIRAGRAYITDIYEQNTLVTIIIFTKLNYVGTATNTIEGGNNKIETFEQRTLATESLTGNIIIPTYKAPYSLSDFNGLFFSQERDIANHSIFIPTNWDRDNLEKYKDTTIIPYGPLDYDDLHYGLSIREKDVPNIPVLDYPLSAEETARPGSFKIKFQNDCLLAKSDGVEWIAKNKEVFSRWVRPSDYYIDNLPENCIQGTKAITVTDSNGDELEVSVLNNRAYFLNPNFIEHEQYVQVTIYRNEIQVDKWYAGGIIIPKAGEIKKNDTIQFRWIEAPHDWEIINPGISVYIKVNYYNAPHNYNQDRGTLDSRTAYNYEDGWMESSGFSIETREKPSPLKGGGKLKIPLLNHVPYNLKGLLYSRRTYTNHIYSASRPEPIGLY